MYIVRTTDKYNTYHKIGDCYQFSTKVFSTEVTEFHSLSILNFPLSATVS